MSIAVAAVVAVALTAVASAAFAAAAFAAAAFAAAAAASFLTFLGGVFPALGRHEEWGGRNHFFAGGRVMMGSDVRWFMSSNITLTVPVMLFAWETFAR